MSRGTRGVTDSTVTVGVELSQNGDASRRSAGVSIDAGDGERYNEVMVDWVNRTGGIGGRKAAYTIHWYDETSSQTTPSQEQEACTTFTQDKSVYAVMAMGQVIGAYHTDNFWNCLDKAGVASLMGWGTTVTDKVGFDAHPLRIEPNGFTLDRVAQITVAGLQRQGYFKGATLGLLALDAPEFHRAVDRALVPALKQVGQRLADTVYVPIPQSSGELAGTSAQLQNAVLRFRERGVDHVLMLEAGGGVAYLFTNAAEGQQYRPRYGWNSQDGLQAVATLIPAAQAAGSLFVGWQPYRDVGTADLPPAWPAVKECLAIYRAAGIALSPSLAAATALQICDQWRFLRRATEAAGRFAVGAMSEALDAVGSSWESGLVGPTRFDRGKRYGAVQYRHGAYDSGCSCFRYRPGPPVRAA